MKILIVGEAGDTTRIQSTLKTLGVLFEPPVQQGQSLEHTFTTRYFTQQVGLWIDQHESLKEWVDAYLGQDAAEVRQALGAVIFTSQGDLAEASRFAEALEGVLVASTAGYEDDFIVSIPQDELLDAIHSAIADWGDGQDNEHSAGLEAEYDADIDTDQLLEPLMGSAHPQLDIESITQTLKEARLSDMSDAQKRQLAEDLAKQLVP